MYIFKLISYMFLALCSQLAFSDEMQKDIGVSESNYIDFIRQTAKATALAETPYKNAVKFMALGINPSGEVVVKNIAIGSDHGASFKPSTGAAVIAHVHNSKMLATPEVADFEALHAFGLPCFVISADGETISEIAIIGGIKKYRAVLSSGVSEWVNF